VVEDIAPSTVHLVLQPTITSALPVRITTSGELPHGLAFAAPLAVDPPSVRVRGPAPRVRGLDSIHLDPLELGDVTTSGAHALAVDTTGLGDLSISPLSVTVSLRLEPAAERTLPAVPVVVEAPPAAAGPSPAFVVVPATIEVRLAGGRTPVEGTREEDVRAVIPWDELVSVPPGEARTVPFELRGIPALVRAFVGADSVLVQRGRP
jgi:hypothetical protein